MVAPVYTVHDFTQNGSKKVRIRRQRIIPTRRIRRDKKRRIRRKGKGKGETKKKRITKRKDPKTIEKRKTEKIYRYFSENSGLFRFVSKQFCLFRSFR